MRKPILISDGDSGEMIELPSKPNPKYIMNTKEFYGKYWNVDGKPVNLSGDAYFDAFCKAQDEGKGLIVGRRRTPPQDYYWKNQRTLLELQSGKKVAFLTPDIEKAKKEFEYWTKQKLFYKKTGDNCYDVSLTEL